MPPSTTLKPPLRVAVTGASGLVGGRLVAALLGRGHAVTALTRATTREGTTEGRVTWRAYDPYDRASAARAVEGCDVVVHLAGENLFGRRWNGAAMADIRRSREDATRALVEGIASLPSGRPRTLVSASAVGYYGPLDPDATVDETAPAGSDFLAEVCAGWEREALAATAHGQRVAIARIGIVLARDGGALRKMWLPFQLGVGGPIGSGRQVMSWIHVDDLVAMLVTMAEDARWTGAFNATSPHPVSSKAFAKALGRAMKRPAFLPTPGFGLRLLFGKVASILTTGQRVLPRSAERLGFTWRHATIDDALDAVVRG
jgi:hypothetical protein